MIWKGIILSLLLFRLSKNAQTLINLSAIFDNTLETFPSLRFWILQRMAQSVYRHEVILASSQKLSRYL